MRKIERGLSAFLSHSPAGRRGGKPYGSHGATQRFRARRVPYVSSRATPPELPLQRSSMIEFNLPGRTANAIKDSIKAKEANRPKVKQPTSNADELFARGEKDTARLRGLLDIGKGVSQRLGGREVDMKGALAHKGAESLIVVAPPKKRETAMKKVAGRYGGDITRLTDLSRATVSVHSIDEIPRAMEAVRAEAKKQGWKIHAPENRFIHEPGSPVHTGPLPSGYRDLSMQLVDQHGVPHELQITTHAMLHAKETKGHKLYEARRAITDAAPNRELTPAEAAQVKHIDEQSRQLYEAALSASWRPRPR